MEQVSGGFFRPLTPAELNDYLRPPPATMEKQISGKGGLFTAEELDLVICALIRYATELRSRLPIMEKYASAQHLANHKVRIAVGERLLKDLN